MTAALTSEASIWTMLLMLGFGGLGFAMFSVGMKLEKMNLFGRVYRVSRVRPFGRLCQLVRRRHLRLGFRRAARCAMRRQASL
jgi:hypothetical protein